MNPAIVLKLLDLAFLGLSAYERYQSQQSENDVVAAAITDLRARYLAGDIDDETFTAEIDVLLGGVIQKRRDAFAALPKPTHQL